MTHAAIVDSPRPHRRHAAAGGDAHAAEESVAFASRLELASGVRSALEAQVHWPRPWRGSVLGRAAFSGGATGSNGRMAAFGGRLLRTVCCEARAWPRPWRVSVGVAACQITQGVLLAQVAEALAESGLDPERLELEIAEPVLLEADADLLLSLAALRDLGTSVGLDDFGSGVSSLSLLRRIPLSFLKLDPTLIRRLPDASEDRSVVAALVAAAHGIGLEVVASGIETEPQRGFLLQSGCDHGQGHLFGAATPARSFRRAGEGMAAF